MKTYVVLIHASVIDRDVLISNIEDKIFDDTDDIKKTLFKHSKTLARLVSPLIIPLYEFSDIWNNTDDDNKELSKIIETHWLVYCKIKETKKTYDSSTVGALINILDTYPKDMRITDEQNFEFIHTHNDNERIILSTTKPIGTCNRTGDYVYPSMVEGYSAFSPSVDEDLFDFEWTPLDLFDVLDEVDEKLRNILEIVDLKNLPYKDAVKWKSICEAFGYTFCLDIYSKPTRLRRIC